MKKRLYKILILLYVILFSYINYSLANINYNEEKAWVDLPNDRSVIKNYEDQNLIKLIKGYHKIDKRDFKKLKDRINWLSKILQYIDDNQYGTSNKVLIQKLQNLIKKKKWYLSQLSLIYDKPNREKVLPFLKVIDTSNYKFLYLKNQIKFDYDLPTYWGLYILEMIDPCRRMLTPFYKKWFYQYKDLYPYFFIWLEGEDVTFRTPQTKIFNDIELLSLKVEYQDGIFKSASTNKLLNLDLNEEYIYVFTLNQELYVAPSSNTVKHTSFTKGMPVLGAGSIKVQNGRLMFIDNESGHYQPDPYILQQLLGLLKDKYLINIKEVKVKYYYLNDIVYEDAESFLSKNFKLVEDISYKNIKDFRF